MTAATPARLAICGFGLIGQRHAAAIAASDSATLVAIAEPSAPGKASAEAWAPVVCDGIEDLFDGPSRPDGIILATPTPMHAEQSLAAIAAGVPLVIEKPIADTYARAEQIVAAAEASGVPVLVGHHRRHNPRVAAAKAALDAGRIGAVRAVHATCWLYKPDHYFAEAPWRTRVGAGPVSVNLVHDVDLMRHFCGEVARVFAVAAASRRGFENEDVASAVLEFTSGAVGTVTISDSIAAPWSWEFTAAENPVYPHIAGESAYLIGGSEGSLSIPDMRLWTHEGAPDWWTPMAAETLTAAEADPLVEQIDQFVGVIAGRATPLVSAREGARSLQVIEAIQRSAATRTPVDITDL